MFTHYLGIYIVGKQYLVNFSTICIWHNSARNSLLKFFCHNDWTKQDITCQYICLSCLYQYGKVKSAESTVKQQEYRCFKLLNEISCIPQAKITLVKKDINVFCTVIADEY